MFIQLLCFIKSISSGPINNIYYCRITFHIFLDHGIKTCFILFPGQKETVAGMPAVFNHSLMDSQDINTEYEFPTSCLQKLCILVRRLCLQQKRNYVSLQISYRAHPSKFQGIFMFYFNRSVIMTLLIAA
jgi:hypothetical protein